MSKMDSGFNFIFAGIALSIVGRLVMSFTRGYSSVALAGLMVVWMLASVVFVLFGLFRLVVSALSRSRKNTSD